MGKAKRVFRGERLKAIREMRGFSQGELEERLSLGNTQIYRYKTSKADPSSDVLVRLATELEVTVDYLLGLVDTTDGLFTEQNLTPDERRLLSAFRRKDAVDGMRVFANHLATET